MKAVYRTLSTGKKFVFCVTFSQPVLASEIGKGAKKSSEIRKKILLCQVLLTVCDI